MKTAGVLAIAALAMVCSGQDAARRPDLTGVAKIESGFELKLKNLDPADPFDRLGACSGVYLSGYGLVFTTPLSLVAAPAFGPFTGGFTVEKAEAVHKRKLAHLPVLRKAMREMVMDAARAFSALPPNEKIVVAARLFYMDYESKTGLPDQIVMAADRASAMAGNVQEEQ
jgi:hypothetical protein